MLGFYNTPCTILLHMSMDCSNMIIMIFVLPPCVSWNCVSWKFSLGHRMAPDHDVWCHLCMSTSKIQYFFFNCHDLSKTKLNLEDAENEKPHQILQPSMGSWAEIWVRHHPKKKFSKKKKPSKKFKNYKNQTKKLKIFKRLLKSLHILSRN